MSARLIGGLDAAHMPVARVNELRNLMGQNDNTLAELVITRLPVGSYSNVAVQTLRAYAFMGVCVADSRVITLTVTRSEVCSSLFYAFFTGLGLMHNNYLDGNIDRGRLRNELMRS